MIFLGLASGFAIMGAILMLALGLQRIITGKRKGTEKEAKILATIVGLFYLIFWLNGSSAWIDYDGSFNFGDIVASLLMNPIEITSGVEHIFNLEPGTLGGWK